MNREEFMARVAHQCWVSYQMGAGQKYNVEPTEAQLKSQLDGVRFFLKTPNATSEQNHENWMKCRLADGWKHGPVKDEAKKEHPDLIPYCKLPEVERAKDDMDLASRRFALRMWYTLHPEDAIPGMVQAVERVEARLAALSKEVLELQLGRKTK